MVNTLRTDADLRSRPLAVEELVGHCYFQPHVTPLQLFNRATDPFLPAVRPHTFAVLDDLDARGLRNHVLVITRHQMKPGDVERLNALRNLKVSLLFTYLQHALGFQVHDVRHPHRTRQHGRADIGWEGATRDD